MNEELTRTLQTNLIQSYYRVVKGSPEQVCREIHKAEPIHPSHSRQAFIGISILIIEKIEHKVSLIDLFYGTLNKSSELTV